MKTIFFWLFPVAVAFGVCSCNNNSHSNSEIITETDFDCDSVCTDVDDRVNNEIYVTIPADYDDGIEYEIESGYSEANNTFVDADSEDDYIYDFFDDYPYLKLWIKTLNKEIPVQFGKFRILDSVEFSNNLLTLEYLTDEKLFEHLDRAIADDTLRLLLKMDNSTDKEVISVYNELRNELYHNAISVKLIFISDGVPAERKSYTYSATQLKTALEND